jgi:hypothetical protein
MHRSAASSKARVVVHPEVVVEQDGGCVAPGRVARRGVTTPDPRIGTDQERGAKPVLRVKTAARTRSRHSSSLRMRPTWVMTVASLRKTGSPISALDRPRAMLRPQLLGAISHPAQGQCERRLGRGLAPERDGPRRASCSGPAAALRRCCGVCLTGRPAIARAPTAAWGVAARTSLRHPVDARRFVRLLPALVVVVPVVVVVVLDQRAQPSQSESGPVKSVPDVTHWLPPPARVSTPSHAPGYPLVTWLAQGALSL